MPEVQPAKSMKGDIEAAEAHSRKALDIEPRFGPAWNNLALVALERGDRREALGFLEKAAETGYEPHPDLVREIKAGLDEA